MARDQVNFASCTDSQLMMAQVSPQPSQCNVRGNFSHRPMCCHASWKHSANEYMWDKMSKTILTHPDTKNYRKTWRPKAIAAMGNLQRGVLIRWCSDHAQHCSRWNFREAMERFAFCTLVSQKQIAAIADVFWCILEEIANSSEVETCVMRAGHSKHSQKPS